MHMVGKSWYRYHNHMIGFGKFEEKYEEKKGKKKKKNEKKNKNLKLINYFYVLL